MSKVDVVSPSYRLEVPQQVNHFREVLHISNEVKYLTWRLRKANRYIKELDQLERAFSTMMFNNVNINHDDYDKAVESLGRTILIAFNNVK
jgi:hypothetical protein